MFHPQKKFVSHLAKSFRREKNVQKFSFFVVDHDVIQSIILYNTYSFVTILVAPIYQKNRQWSMPTKISVAKKSGGFISETNDCTGKKITITTIIQAA